MWKLLLADLFLFQDDIHVVVKLVSIIVARRLIISLIYLVGSQMNMMIVMRSLNIVQATYKHALCEWQVWSAYHHTDTNWSSKMNET